MPTPSLSVPVNVENFVISSNLNSSMMFNLLMGIYTMVYCGTMYIYLSRKPSSTTRNVVICSISLLYLICLLDFSLQWYYLNWSLVVNGSTRDSIFVGSLSSPTWLHIFNEFLFNFLFVISDALLIWRCYHVWGQSIKMISVSLILLTAELALSLTSTIFDGTSPILATKARETLSNNIATALAFVSLGTTFSATFLIGYRVHFLTNAHILSFKSFYNRIVLIVVESAALYSLVFLFWGIILVIPIFHNLESPLVEVVPYVEIVLTIGAGLAPTVMVARLALEEPGSSPNCSANRPPISGLNFNHQYASAGSSQDGTTSAVIDMEKSPTEKDVKGGESHHAMV